MLISAGVFVAAGLWGLYWLPLRHIDSHGINGLWAVLAAYLIPLLALLPLALLRRRQIAANASGIALISLFLGAGLACYTSAFLYTSIMRTTLLFYLTPVWSTLLGIVLLGEKPAWQRWSAMIIGFSGLSFMVIAGNDQQSAGGFNHGDVLALLSGVLWGAGTVLVQRDQHIDSVDVVPAQYFFATLLSALALLAGGEILNPPSTAAWSAAMPWLIGYFVLIMLPSLYVCVHAAKILSPGRVGILMMSEVLVAGISAPLLAGETLSPVEWLAGALIVLAGLLEISTPVASPAAGDRPNQATG